MPKARPAALPIRASKAISFSYHHLVASRDALLLQLDVDASGTQAELRAGLFRLLARQDDDYPAGVSNRDVAGAAGDGERRGTADIVAGKVRHAFQIVNLSDRRQAGD